MNEISMKDTGTTVPQDPEKLTVGQQLRRARESRGLSLANMAEALKLGRNQVEALENDNWSALPGTTFVRGFVRNYGRLLGLDTDSLMAQLELRLNAEKPELVLPESTHVDMPNSTVRTQARDYWLVIAGVLLMLTAVSIFFLLPDDMGRLRAGAAAFMESISNSLKRDSQAAPSPKPASEPGPQPVLPPGSTVNQVLSPQDQETLVVASTTTTTHAQPEPVPPVTSRATETPAPSATSDQPTSATPIRLQFVQDSWVEIRDRRGNVVYSQNALANSERAVEGQGPFSLVIGNAKGVRLTFRGQPVDLTSHTKGEVARLTLE